MAAKNKPNELYITRIYDAPVKLVWEAWTDPKKAALWWGPRGFTITTHSKDLRPGGTWVYTMHGPDGVDYPNKTFYHEVEKYSRLVYDHGANDEQPPLFRVTVDFTETKGKTKMEMTMSLPNEEAAKATAKFIKQAGGNSTWDRLAEYLAKTDANKEQFVINRSFAAPMEEVFALWTHPEHLSQWLPPAGMTMKSFQGEIKPGGEFTFVMGDATNSVHGKNKYLEIQPSDLLIYELEFRDENGKALEPAWPLPIVTTVMFSQEGPTQTRVTVLWEPKSSATAAEIECFITARAGMAQGWNGAFDKLDDRLARRK